MTVMSGLVEMICHGKWMGERKSLKIKTKKKKKHRIRSERGIRVCTF